MQTQVLVYNILVWRMSRFGSHLAKLLIKLHLKLLINPGHAYFSNTRPQEHVYRIWALCTVSRASNISKEKPLAMRFFRVKISRKEKPKLHPFIRTLGNFFLLLPWPPQMWSCGATFWGSPHGNSEKDEQNDRSGFICKLKRNRGKILKFTDPGFAEKCWGF